jgi:hypothetical protein
MKTVVIYADNSIGIGSTITGYRVDQKPEGTVVRRHHNNNFPPPRDMGEVVDMPAKRYALSTEEGQLQFAADLLKLREEGK